MAASRRELRPAGGGESSPDRLAKTGYIGIFASAFVTTPCVVSLGDSDDVRVSQLTMNAISERAELAGIDEEGLAAALAKAIALLAASKEPEAHWNLCRKEELAGKGDHAADQVGLNNVLPNLALAVRVGLSRSIAVMASSSNVSHLPKRITLIETVNLTVSSVYRGFKWWPGADSNRRPSR